VRKRSEDTKKASSPEGCPLIDDIKMQKNFMKKILKEMKRGMVSGALARGKRVL